LSGVKELEVFLFKDWKKNPGIAAKFIPLYLSLIGGYTSEFGVISKIRTIQDLDPNILVQDPDRSNNFFGYPNFFKALLLCFSAGTSSNSVLRNWIAENIDPFKDISHSPAMRMHSYNLSKIEYLSDFLFSSTTGKTFVKSPTWKLLRDFSELEGSAARKIICRISPMEENLHSLPIYDKYFLLDLSEISRDFGDVTEVETTEPEECEEGWEWDSILGECVPIEECGPGEEWDSTLGECIPIECPDGMQWDFEAEQCVVIETRTECEEGMMWDSDLEECVEIEAETECPAGYEYDTESGECIFIECQAGYEWDADAETCIEIETRTSCPDGYEWDADAGMCIETEDETQGCPPGTKWDPKTSECVPIKVQAVIKKSTAGTTVTTDLSKTNFKKSTAGTTVTTSYGTDFKKAGTGTTVANLGGDGFPADDADTAPKTINELTAKEIGELRQWFPAPAPGEIGEAWNNSQEYQTLFDRTAGYKIPRIHQKFAGTGRLLSTLLRLKQSFDAAVKLLKQKYL